MRTLTITTALLAGCTTQAIGNTEYDEIARMVGTTITMPESGGDVGAALEAFACRNCRLVEWHASTLADVKPNGVDIIELDGSESPPPDAPYR